MAQAMVGTMSAAKRLGRHDPAVARSTNYRQTYLATDRMMAMSRRMIGFPLGALSGARKIRPHRQDQGARIKGRADPSGEEKITPTGSALFVLHRRRPLRSTAVSRPRRRGADAGRFPETRPIGNRPAVAGAAATDEDDAAGRRHTSGVAEPPAAQHRRGGPRPRVLETHLLGPKEKTTVCHSPARPVVGLFGQTRSIAIAES